MDDIAETPNLPEWKAGSQIPETTVYTFPKRLSYHVERTDLPETSSEVDRKAFDKVLAVPWLRSSVVPTGQHWGRRIADVTMSNVPPNLVGMVMLVVDDETKHPRTDQVRLVFNGWDREAYLGWAKDFHVVLTFPRGVQYDADVPSSSRLLDGHSVIIQVEPDVIVRERPQQAGRAIPRILFNVSQPLENKESHEVRRGIRNVRFITDIVQCTSMYVVVEDEACRREVEASTIPNFREAYEALIPGSYKADLVRYYLLYKYGGVYVDDKSTIRHSLDSAAFDSFLAGQGGSLGAPCDMFISIFSWMGVPTPEIAFLAARPGCEVILKVLEKAIDNIMKRLYNTNRLDITGNTTMGRVIEAGADDQQRLPLIELIKSSTVGVPTKWVRSYGENIALLGMDASTERIYFGPDLIWHRQSIPFRSWPKPSTYYWHLWNTRGVYVDGNPPVSSSLSLRLLLTSNHFLTTVGVLIGFAALFLLGYIFLQNPTLSL